MGVHYNTHTHPFNGPLSGTTRVSQYQKGKTNLDFTEARDSEWQWHQLGNMQVCNSLQTDNHASTPPLSFLQAGQMPFLPPNQQRQSTERCTLQQGVKCVVDKREQVTTTEGHVPVRTHRQPQLLVKCRQRRRLQCERQRRRLQYEWATLHKQYVHIFDDTKLTIKINTAYLVCILTNC